jgi:hypothetical protein
MHMPKAEPAAVQQPARSSEAHWEDVAAQLLGPRPELCEVRGAIPIIGDMVGAGTGRAAADRIQFHTGTVDESRLRRAVDSPARLTPAKPIYQFLTITNRSDGDRGALSKPNVWRGRGPSKTWIHPGLHCSTCFIWKESLA